MYVSVCVKTQQNLRPQKVFLLINKLFVTLANAQNFAS